MPVVEMPPKKQGQARLVVVESVSYHTPGENVFAVTPRYGKWIDSDEQPIVNRRLKVGTGWTELTGLWLSEASAVIIENPAPEFQAIPAPEALAEAYSAVLEWGIQITEGLVALVGPIPPGESVRFMPAHLSALRIRCSRESKFVISVFPK